MKLIYNGFEIDPVTFQIYKGGKEVFSASWQRNISLAGAKSLIDASNAKTIERIPSKIKPLVTKCELENGSAAAEEFSNWMNNEAEKELLNF